MPFFLVPFANGKFGRRLHADTERDKGVVLFFARFFLQIDL